MKPYIMVSTTFDSKGEAEKMVDILLNKRLVSCCQLSKIESAYHWEGKIEKANEYLLQMKSKKALYKEIEKTMSIRACEYCCAGFVCPTDTIYNSNPCTSQSGAF